MPHAADPAARDAAAAAAAAIARARPGSPADEVRFARQLELAARAQARASIRRAREAGLSWDAIGQLLGFGPIAGTAGSPSVGELAFDYAAGPRTVHAWFPAPPLFRWDCPACGQRIADHGPAAGPRHDEAGHRDGCQRLAEARPPAGDRQNGGHAMTGPEHYAAGRAAAGTRPPAAGRARRRARGAGHLARPGRARRRPGTRHLGPGRRDRAQRRPGRARPAGLAQGRGRAHDRIAASRPPDLRHHVAMGDRYRTADGWSVEVVHLEVTPDRHDGEWIRLRQHGCWVESGNCSGRGETRMSPPGVLPTEPEAPSVVEKYVCGALTGLRLTHILGNFIWRAAGRGGHDSWHRGWLRESAGARMVADVGIMPRASSVGVWL